MVYINEPNLSLQLLHYLSFLLCDIMRGKLLLLFALNKLPKCNIHPNSS